MVTNLLEYKGYHTKIQYDCESHSLRGKIEGINDYVDFQTSDPSKVEDEFHKAVDDYLIFCEKMGKCPDKEYKGTFNIRINPNLHKRLAIYADKIGTSLNSTVESAIIYYLNDKTENVDPLIIDVM
ncbi:MAG TPA: toxin-antitoxin system HicB family antitoxin [Lachnospiraceae bacterium]|nr:toxin-antitoxin system HicB family antitoxin [Lachnospiraceae bacterium]